MAGLDRSFGREAFGADPANYHAARPPYPEATWAALRERANLRTGIDVLEIGAGTGLATMPLMAHDPARLTAIEPDARLAEFLRAKTADERLQVVTAPFEETDLPAAAFDLVVSATAFHWLEAETALRRIHGLLRETGAIALVWNVFGDESRADAFHEATTHLFAGQRTGPSGGGSGDPVYSLDAELRLADLTKTGFRPDPPQFVRWTLSLNPRGVRDLYSTYSNVAALPAAERQTLLESLAAIAEGQFAGRVERNMTTAIYTARKQP